MTSVDATLSVRTTRITSLGTRDPPRDPGGPGWTPGRDRMTPLAQDLRGREGTGPDGGQSLPRLPRRVGGWWVKRVFSCCVVHVLFFLTPFYLLEFLCFTFVFSLGRHAITFENRTSTCLPGSRSHSVEVGPPRRGLGADTDGCRWCPTTPTDSEQFLTFFFFFNLPQ